KRISTTIEGQIFYADIDHEIQPRFDLLDHHLGNTALLCRELKPFQEFLGITDRIVGEIDDILSPDQDMQGFFPKSGAVAFRAWFLSEKMFRSQAIAFGTCSIWRVEG